MATSSISCANRHTRRSSNQHHQHARRARQRCWAEFRLSSLNVLGHTNRPADLSGAVTWLRRSASLEADWTPFLQEDSVKRQKVAKDTHFRAIYTIFYSTGSGVDHLVFPTAHIRGEYSADYAAFLADHKHVVSAPFNSQEFKDAIFDLSAVYLRDRIKERGKDLKSGGSEALAKRLIAIGKHLLNAEHKRSPKKGGVLHVMLCYVGDELKEKLVKIYDPDWKDPVGVFDRVIEDTVEYVSLIYSNVYGMDAAKVAIHHAT